MRVTKKLVTSILRDVGDFNTKEPGPWKLIGELGKPEYYRTHAQLLIAQNRLQEAMRYLVLAEAWKQLSEA